MFEPDNRYYVNLDGEVLWFRQDEHKLNYMSLEKIVHNILNELLIKIRQGKSLERANRRYDHFRRLLLEAELEAVVDYDDHLPYY